MLREEKLLVVTTMARRTGILPGNQKQAASHPSPADPPNGGLVVDLTLDPKMKAAVQTVTYQSTAWD